MTTPAASAAKSPRASRHNISPDAIIAQAALPPVLASLVLTVIKRARLWPSERTDVARELSAHFADGLAAGASAEKLVQDFGDPRKAAALIRSSKRRSRPIWYRGLHHASRAVIATFFLAIAIYAILLLRVTLVRPNIARNFSAEYNARIAAIPVYDRAWPLYIRAIYEFGTPLTLPPNNYPDSPDDPCWNEHLQWLDSRAEALNTVRTAAALPALGRELTTGIGSDYEEALRAVGRMSGTYQSDPVEENPFMMGVLLPHLGEVRTLARHLRADSFIAVQNGNADRYLADIRAMLGISRQCMGESFLISQLVGLAIADLAFERLVETPFTPGFMSDPALRDLAHEIAAFGGGRVRLDFDQERVMVQDILQRYFSDDGHGGGYYVGTPDLRRMYRDFGTAPPAGLPLLQSFVPIQSLLIPSRAELGNLLERAIETAQRDETVEPWRHDERISKVWWERLMNSGVYDLFPILRSLMSSDKSPMLASIAARDAFEGKRDAVLLKCALTLYHRQTGSWPASLDQLSPRLLPAVPLDPFTGTAIRYKLDPLTDSPIVYSIGVDGIDNAGEPPSTEVGILSARTFRWYSYFKQERAQAQGQPLPSSSHEELPPLTGAEQTQMNEARGDWIYWRG
jgi:hypothetical protein